ncbi:MAG: hypothetical protein HYY35_08285 [Deltaproteobacteria bacterium]|nr:hypothetical protein [Deltaproteobacteria bacterium]
MALGSKPIEGPSRPPETALPVERLAGARLTGQPLAALPPPAPARLQRLRIDLVLQGRTDDFTRAFDVVRGQGGTTVGVGRYTDRRAGGKPICYLRVRAQDVRSIAEQLARVGYGVLGVHP